MRGRWWADEGLGRGGYKQMHRRTDHQALLAVCFLCEWKDSNLNLGYIVTVLK